jgi:hypothetical protein
MSGMGCLHKKTLRKKPRDKREFMQGIGAMAMTPPEKRARDNMDRALVGVGWSFRKCKRAHITPRDESRCVNSNS